MEKSGRNVPDEFRIRVGGRDEHDHAFYAWADARRPLTEQFPGCSVSAMGEYQNARTDISLVVQFPHDFR